MHNSSFSAQTSRLTYLQDQKVIDSALRQIPFRRFGKPEDSGPLAVYLASDEASFVTGQAYVIDGGQISH